MSLLSRQELCPGKLCPQLLAYPLVEAQAPGTQGHLLPLPEPPRPGTRAWLCVEATLLQWLSPHRPPGIELSAELPANSPFLSGGLQFKNIKIPVVLVFYGLSYPRWDIVKGDGSDYIARNLLKVCKVMKFGEQN